MKLSITNIALLLIVFTVWSMFLVPILADGQLFILSFFIFVSIYVYLAIWMVGEPPHKSKKGFKIFLGWLMLFLTFDILVLPFILDRDNYIEPVQSAKLSSDYSFYSLMPDFLPHIAKYWIVYVLVPTILIVLAYMILGKKNFGNAVRENV